MKHFRQLEAGEPFGAAVRLERLGRQCRPAQHHVGLDALPEACVGLADHRRLHHLRVREQRALDLLGVHLDAAAVDQVVDAPGDEQIAVCVDEAHVAAAPPAVDEARTRLRRVLPVAERERRPAHRDLADRACRQHVVDAARGRDDTQIGADHRLAGRGELALAHEVGVARQHAAAATALARQVQARNPRAGRGDDALEVAPGRRFARDRRQAQAGQVVGRRVLGEHQPPHRRHQRRHRHALAGERLEKARRREVRIEHRLRRRADVAEHDVRPGGERRVHQHQGRIVRRDAEVAGLCAARVFGERGLAVHDAIRPPGGARGQHDRGQRLGREWRLLRIEGPRRLQRGEACVVERLRRATAGGGRNLPRQRREVGIVQQEFRVEPNERLGEALRRFANVQVASHCAAHQAGEVRQRVAHRAAAEQRNTIAGLDAARGEAGSEPQRRFARRVPAHPLAGIDEEVFGAAQPAGAQEKRPHHAVAPLRAIAR